MLLRRILSLKGNLDGFVAQFVEGCPEGWVALEKAERCADPIGFLGGRFDGIVATCDPAVNPSVSTAIFLETRDAVDTAVTKGLAAGGVEPHPATDYGFMYQRQLNDPDGNILEFGYMDPVAAEQGPEAYANQQA